MQRRVGAFECWGGPHAAANQDVVSDDFAIANDRQIPKVLGIDIDTVVFWKCDAHLEFTGQVSRSVERFGNGAAAFERLFAGFRIGYPELVVGGSLGGQGDRHFVGQLSQLVMDATDAFGGTAHDVSVYIATRCQRRQFHRVDPMNRLTQVVFQDAVQLQRLAGGDLDGRVAKLVTEVQLGQHLLAGDSTAGDAAADHHRERFSATLFFQFCPFVAVVLLVSPVKLQQLDIVFIEVIGIGSQFFADRAAQELALFFDLFNGAKL